MSGPAVSAPDFLAQASTAVEKSMELFMEGRSLPLYRMMGYQLGWVDENGTPREANRPLRVRGALCLLAASAISGRFKDALRHAVAIELVHNYSQMHADVQEGNTERAGRGSVWWVWGPAQAINAGDGMHALARLAMFELSKDGVAPELVSDALQALDLAALDLCEGSYFDTVYQERVTILVDEYLQMTARASGALVGCATRLGAMAAGETGSSRLDALQKFGQKCGISMRLSSDLRAFWDGSDRSGPLQGRILAKKKTLPVIHALEKADVKTKRALGEIYAQRVLDPGDIEKVRGILEAAGSRAYTEQVIAKLNQEASAALADAGIGQPEADRLLEAAQFATRTSG
ncbi:MAG: hypothetical protein FJ314_09345 [SAR202 cluster bacterium]|nr:hypothetical protein [SAR202 cluster bacterium]